MSEKLTRHDVREGVFLLLFQNELSGSPVEELAEACEEAYEMVVTKEMISTANAVIAKYGELDGIIGEFSETREVQRISRVNKTILRLAIYEMTYSDRIPAPAAVNEAVELAKKYADKPDSAFINGILGNYIKRLGKDADK
ncbi:MAG: transcription antitermination factor NusB [Ruminiclostridium sp.]|nr:transcription antitermination factor NusB [Ruminiclostridium sp.]